MKNILLHIIICFVFFAQCKKEEKLMLLSDDVFNKVKYKFTCPVCRTQGENSFLDVGYIQPKEDGCMYRIYLCDQKLDRDTSAKEHLYYAKACHNTDHIRKYCHIDSYTNENIESDNCFHSFLSESGEMTFILKTESINMKVLVSSFRCEFNNISFWSKRKPLMWKYIVGINARSKEDDCSPPVLVEDTDSDTDTDESFDISLADLMLLVSPQGFTETYDQIKYVIRGK